MNIELVKIILGFLLTTLCGGVLGFIFQKRHQRYQWQKNRQEKELDAALQVFNEISRLLDKRLYRAQQFYWSLAKSETIRKHKEDDYRVVVYEWNDNINRILALLAIYFPPEIRERLDGLVGAELVRVGRGIEKALHQLPATPEQGIEDRLSKIGSEIYHFNLMMLRHIQQKRARLEEDA